MKKLLLITGDLATGKSTFAKMLSQKYNVPCFSKDSIKEVLGDSIGFTNRAENLKLSKATIQLMNYIFKIFAEQKQDLILEANFHSLELEELHRIATENQYQILSLVMRGDVHILHQRYLNRISLEHRHPVHLSTTFDIFDDFEAYILKSRKEQILGDSITIIADNFFYQEDVHLLNAIERFFNQK